jgi:hypothetical protein
MENRRFEPFRSRVSADGCYRNQGVGVGETGRFQGQPPGELVGHLFEEGHEARRLGSGSGYESEERGVGPDFKLIPGFLIDMRRT